MMMMLRMIGTVLMMQTATTMIGMDNHEDDSSNYDDYVNGDADNHTARKLWLWQWVDDSPGRSVTGKMILFIPLVAVKDDAGADYCHGDDCGGHDRQDNTNDPGHDKGAYDVCSAIVAL